MRFAGRLRPRLTSGIRLKKAREAIVAPGAFCFEAKRQASGSAFKRAQVKLPTSPFPNPKTSATLGPGTGFETISVPNVLEVNDQRTAGRQPSKVRGDRVKDLASTQRREERCSGRAQDGYRSRITISHETSEASAIESPMRSELRLLTGMPQAYHPPCLHHRPETQLPSSRSFSLRRGIAPAARLPRAGRYVRAET